MSNFRIPSRRQFLRNSVGLSTAVAASSLLPFNAAKAANLTVGFIYVGPKDDYGYNQSHAEGAAAVKAMAGVTVVEEERVPETVDVQKTMESMINLMVPPCCFQPRSAISTPIFSPWLQNIPKCVLSIAADCGPRTSPRMSDPTSAISAWANI